MPDQTQPKPINLDDPITRELLDQLGGLVKDAEAARIKYESLQQIAKEADVALLRATKRLDAYCRAIAEINDAVLWDGYSHGPDRTGTTRHVLKALDSYRALPADSAQTTANASISEELASATSRWEGVPF